MSEPATPLPGSGAPGWDGNGAPGVQGIPGWDGNGSHPFSSPLIADVSTLTRPRPELYLPDADIDEEPGHRQRARRRRSEVSLVVAADLLSLLGALVVGLLLLAALSSAGTNSIGTLGHNLLANAAFPLTALLAFATYGLYRQSRRRLRPNSFGELGGLIHAVAVGAFLNLGVGVLVHRLTGRAEVPPAQVVALALCAVVTVPSGRAIARRLARLSSRSATRVLVVGSGMMADRVQRYLRADGGVQIVGVVDDDPMPGTTVLGGIVDLPTICADHRVDRILVGFSRTHPQETLGLLRLLHGTIPISIVPRYFELLSWRSEVEELYGLPVIDVAPPYLGTGARFAKRTFDVVVSGVGLALLSPVLAVAAVAIKATSAGPVLFRQARAGRGGRPFSIFKLRTMVAGAEEEQDALFSRNESDGPMFKIRDDPRITTVGRFLRKTSLDEVPQLLNVFMGQMSLVGPRPFVVHESEQIAGWAARRFEVRPGITGLWQVSGRSDLTYDELQRLDYLYVASWSLWWDLRILWHTPTTVIRGNGAY
ncbi:MAG: sugar transferase [Acidimicrobiales bacterium]